MIQTSRGVTWQMIPGQRTFRQLSVNDTEVRQNHFRDSVYPHQCLVSDWEGDKSFQWKKLAKASSLYKRSDAPTQRVGLNMSNFLKRTKKINWHGSTLLHTRSRLAGRSQGLLIITLSLSWVQSQPELIPIISCISLPAEIWPSKWAVSGPRDEAY